MSRFILSLFLLITACTATPPPKPAPVPAETASYCRIARVIDGDTVKVTCRGTGETSARLTGFDAPELNRPACATEARQAVRARDRLTALILNAPRVDAFVSGRDKYRRLLMRLEINGRNVGDTLIAEGLARPYDGGKRGSWCG